jgi:hypothetical protein
VCDARVRCAVRCAWRCSAHSLAQPRALGLHAGLQQPQHVGWKACKVHQQGLPTAHSAILCLAHCQRVQEEGVSVVSHLKVQHAVAAARGAAMGLQTDKGGRGGGWGGREGEAQAGQQSSAAPKDTLGKGACAKCALRPRAGPRTRAPSSRRRVKLHWRASRSPSCTRKGTLPSCTRPSRGEGEEG